MIAIVDKGDSGEFFQRFALENEHMVVTNKVPENPILVHKLEFNGKNKHYFVRNLNKAVIFLGIIQVLFGTLCVFAYGNKL